MATAAATYSYRASLKSDIADELINTWLLRPIAGLIVWALYRTRVTPNQVTIASTVAGIAAAVVYLQGTAGAIATAGLLVTLKDVLDSADGQLARAKQQYSRIGRFLDSIGDFVVDVAVFGAIGWLLVRRSGDAIWALAALAGLIGISLRVSYHVYYQARFLHLKDSYENNRITEEITPDDLRGDRTTLTLQRIFQMIYGWQDRLMLAIDYWSLGGHAGAGDSAATRTWYADRVGLRLSGFLGFGTELFLLMLFSVVGQLELYLIVNIFLLNAVWAGCVLYRKFILVRRTNLFTE